MKDMKYSEEDKKLMSPQPSTIGESDYPYGLQFHLDEASIKKLGIEGVPKVDDTMEMGARVKVVHTSSHDSKDGKERHIGLQITHLSLDKEKSEKKEAADVLYGDKKKQAPKNTADKNPNGSLNHEAMAWGK